MAARSILALELSTSHGSVAVLHDGAVVFESSFMSKRSHNAQLFGPLGMALEACGPLPLDTIVVGLGPGSYTGVRIAIAAAQGVALSRRARVIGLPSMAAIQADGLDESYAVIGDARRGSFHAAVVMERRLAGEIELMDEAALRQWVNGKAEAGRSVCTTDEAVPLDLPGVIRGVPSAAQLAHNASLLTDAELGGLAGQILEPLYLRDAFVTTPRKPWLDVPGAGETT